MIATGTTLQQRYRIDKQIGQGGMGAVYIATDERFGSVVAIKETLCMDDNFRKALEREARLLNSLKHSALPRVSDHFVDDNGQFLVMEYIAGDDVASILERDQKPFQVAQVLKWADQLLDALDYLHNQENPVIHRDIKPQNLKITPRGEIILLDFGLAKGNPTDAGHHTAAKSIFGYSRNYASLEQIQGTGTDPRSDIYALAATLYHLLTNTAPEDALTRAMSVLSQKPDPLQPANVVNPAVPRGVAGVLQRSMALNADERPASAAEMQRMLRESEAYAYLADAATVPNVTGTSVFANQTRLMPEGTHAEGSRSTEAKTEVLPVYASQLTAVHGATGDEAATRLGASHTTSAPKAKRSAFAMAVAGVLALALGGGAVVGGIYLIKPTEPVTQTAAPEQPLAPTANANSNISANVESSAQVSQPTPGGLSPQTPPESHQTQAERQSETAKVDRTLKNTNTEQATQDYDLAPDVKISTTASGDMVITKTDKTGKTTSTTVQMPKPPPVGTPPAGQGYDPFPRGFDPRILTMRQKQQLKEMMMRRGGEYPPPTANRPNRLPVNRPPE